MKVLQQGHADGLCGLYAVLNFLQQTDWADETPEEGLQYLLYCAESLGWFTPHYLTDGYEDYQLKQIIDVQISRYRLPFKTHFVSDTVQSQNISSFGKLVRSVHDANGAIIASKSRRDHWVLIYQKGEKMSVWDSSNGSGVIENLPARTSGYSKDFGVIVVPAEPMLDAWKS